MINGNLLIGKLVLEGIKERIDTKNFNSNLLKFGSLTKEEKTEKIKIINVLNEELCFLFDFHNELMNKVLPEINSETSEIKKMVINQCRIKNNIKEKVSKKKFKIDFHKVFRVSVIACLILLIIKNVEQLIFINNSLGQIILLVFFIIWEIVLIKGFIFIGSKQ